MLILPLFLMFVSIALLSGIFVPIAVAKYNEVNEERAQSVVRKVVRYIPEEERKKTYQLILLGPVVLGAAGFFLFPGDKKIVGLVIGVFFGYLLPSMYVGRILETRKQKFNEQLVDALMIMCSSFRAGLSLVQAFESVADEMPEPIKGEFSVVLGENKMGVSLDESLKRLYARMTTPAVQQMVTAILLARETGGNLPDIFMRIVSSTRERTKIEKNLKTLTVQGKIQGVVMTGLPIVFFFTITGSNPHFFDSMVKTPLGQKLLALCIILWIVGALSIWKISTFKDL